MTTTVEEFVLLLSTTSPYLIWLVYEFWQSTNLIRYAARLAKPSTTRQMLCIGWTVQPSSTTSTNPSHKPDFLW
jgi:hypothetical protein